MCYSCAFTSGDGAMKTADLIFIYLLIIFLSVTLSELDEPLLLLADVALAPPRGRVVCCSCLVKKRVESVQLQLQFLLSKADDLQERLLTGSVPGGS